MRIQKTSVRAACAVLGVLVCLSSALAESRLDSALGITLDTPLTALDGTTTRIAEKRGDRPIYIKFWASWCGTCLEQLPHFQEAWRRHGEDIDFYYVNLGINDSLDYVRTFAREHNLSMTILVDSTGRLADAFGVMGTPWHALADESLALHLNGGSELSQLDTLLAFLADPTKAAAGGVVEVNQASLPTAQSGEDDASQDETPTLHYYLATWCDWYLEDKRPQTAARCVRSQDMVNRLAEQFPDLNVQGHASRLWTGEDELADYRSRHDVRHPVTIDRTNSAFLARSVRDIPTLLLIRDGNAVYRETVFEDFERLAREVRQATQ